MDKRKSHAYGPVTTTTALVTEPLPEGAEHETSTVLCGPETGAFGLLSVQLTTGVVPGEWTLIVNSESDPVAVPETGRVIPRA